MPQFVALYHILFSSDRKNNIRRSTIEAVESKLLEKRDAALLSAGMKFMEYITILEQYFKELPLFVREHSERVGTFL